MTACFFLFSHARLHFLDFCHKFLRFVFIIASDFLIHSTMMHIFLLGVFPDYGIGDGIYGAASSSSSESLR